MMGYVIDWRSPLVAPIISAITALMVVFISTLIVPHFRARNERKRRAQYLAIRVVCILDKYVEACARISGDYGEEDQEGFSHAEHQVPPVPEYPKDVDWHSIDINLMYAILSIPTAAERAANIVSGAGEDADPPDYYDYFETRCDEYGHLALTTNDLIMKLREKYAIPELPGESWSPAEYAHMQLNKIKKRRTERAEMFAEAAAKLDAPTPPPSPQPVTT